MSGIANYPAFLAAVAVFLMLPGPGTFAVLTATARGGHRGGYAALAGLIAGDWGLMAFAMLGVAALMRAHPVFFHAVQIGGALYLGWIGLGLLRTGLPGHATLLPMTDARYARQGFLITLLNPKAIIFYLGFFPLFIDPARYLGAPTLLAMALSISTLTVLYGSLLVFGGAWAARRLQARPRTAGWLARIAGLVLIGFGLRLASH